VECLLHLKCCGFLGGWGSRCLPPPRRDVLRKRFHEGHLWSERLLSQFIYIN